ncbi:MAG: hypothetical protein NVSMB64_26410 [Candidatus Velthaea sp.]
MHGWKKEDYPARTSLGGRTRAARLTPERRSEIARMGAAATNAIRWPKAVRSDTKKGTKAGVSG